MPRIIKSGLIQMSLPKTEGEGTIEEIVQAMYDKHIPLIEEAGKKGVQILCLQEIFNTPYFCPGQDKKWYASAEAVPGPTTEKLAVYAKKYNMVIIVPIYEKEQAGVLYNTAAVIDAGCATAEELLKDDAQIVAVGTGSYFVKIERCRAIHAKARLDPIDRAGVMIEAGSHWQRNA